MKLKKTAIAFVLSLSALPALAQYEGTSLSDRIGHGQDSIDCLNNLTVYTDAYKAKNYAEAYTPWKAVFDKAPLAQLSLYTNGPFLVENLVYKAPDAAKKKEYFDVLMGIFDQRIKYMNELNSFSPAKWQTNKGAVLGRKAFYYAKYGPTADPQNYSLDKAYDMFTEAINLVNEDDSKEVDGFVLNMYIDVSYKKFQGDPTFREQFIKDYMLCKEVCEKMLAKANAAEDTLERNKIVKEYDAPLLYVENTFAQSHAADKDQLIAIFTPKVEQKKTDLAYLKSVLRILQDNDCDDTPIYFKTSEYAYNIEPSYESALGMAKYCKDHGQQTQSVTYYDKALELCPTDKMKANIAYTIARTYARNNNYNLTDSYLDKVAVYNPSMSGKCNLLRAQMLAQQRQYDGAIAYCSKAAREDVTISGTAKRLSDRISEVKRQNAAAAQQNAEYQAALKKRQALDNFWNCK